MTQSGNVWMHTHTVPLHSHFLSSMRMQNNWSLVALLNRNPHWWYPIISTYGVNFEGRKMDKILHVAGNSYTPTVSFLTLLINRYSYRFLPLLWQFFLTPNRITKIWTSERKVLPPNSAAILSVPAIKSVPPNPWRQMCFQVSILHNSSLGIQGAIKQIVSPIK
jgi:hypothetical protein